MIIILRIAIILLGIGFLLPGVVGLLRPERMAEVLALAPDGFNGLLAIRALIAAPYLAMGIITVYAAVRGQWSWLVPIAAIEGTMVIVRIVSGVAGEFDSAGIRTIVMETVATALLTLGAILPPRSPER